MGIPGLSPISGLIRLVEQQLTLAALGAEGIAKAFIGSDSQRPVLFFVRGTGASGKVLNPIHALLYDAIRLLTGLEVVDVRLEGNGLKRPRANNEQALGYICKRHEAEPDRPVLLAGWSRGADVAIQGANQFSFVQGVILIVPCTNGSRLSHPRIPGSLGEYGLEHETTLANRKQVEQWVGSVTPVPGLLLWSPMDLLIWPPKQACIEDAGNIRNVRLGWLSNHFNAPFMPAALIEIAKFIGEVLANPEEEWLPLEGSCEQRRRRGALQAADGEGGLEAHQGRQRQRKIVSPAARAA